MSERILVIVNPRSNSGATGKTLDALRRELDKALADDGYELVLTERPHHATELARTAVGRDVTRLVACGGDGTLSEVVEGIMTSGAPERVVLTPLARGTGSDFMRSLRDYAKNARPSRIPGSRPGELRLDVGRVELTRDDGSMAVRHLLNIASVGLSAESVRWVEEQSRAGKRNRFTYLISAFAGLARYTVTEVEVMVDSSLLYRGPLQTAAIANGAFYGGGMPIAPDACLDDGLFEVVCIAPPSALQVLPFYAAVLRGKHLAHPLTCSARAHEVVMRSRAPIPLEIDGESAGTLPARFVNLPGRLRVSML